MANLRAKDRNFWEKTAARYFAQPVADENAYQTKLNMTRNHLSAETDVFEFGCGTGSTALSHAPFVRSVLATDVSENMLEFGRARAKEQGIENIEFRRTSIEDYEPEDRNFDVVLGLNIIHLCRDPAAVIAKVGQIVKPGGVFIQSTVCLGDFNPLIRVAIPLMQLVGKAPYVHILKKAVLQEYLDVSGFHIIEDWYPGGLTAHFIIARRAME